MLDPEPWIQLAQNNARALRQEVLRDTISAASVGDTKSVFVGSWLSDTGAEFHLVGKTNVE